jgi:hypothetical protein
LAQNYNNFRRDYHRDRHCDNNFSNNGKLSDYGLQAFQFALLGEAKEISDSGFFVVGNRVILSNFSCLSEEQDG